MADVVAASGGAAAITWNGRQVLQTGSSNSRVDAADGSPTTATSIESPAANEAPTSHWANAVGCCVMSGATVPIARSAASRYRPSPVSAARRSNTVAAIAAPDGTALSCGSLGRVMSRS